MTTWDKMLVSIVIDAAKSCLHVFENEYPADDRPRKALEATEKWLSEPTEENRRSVSALVAHRALTFWRRTE
jgi:Imm-5 like putative immunity protein